MEAYMTQEEHLKNDVASDRFIAVKPSGVPILLIASQKGLEIQNLRLINTPSSQFFNGSIKVVSTKTITATNAVISPASLNTASLLQDVSERIPLLPLFQEDPSASVRVNK